MFLLKKPSGFEEYKKSTLIFITNKAVAILILIAFKEQNQYYIENQIAKKNN